MFQVEWLAAALNELALIWMQADSTARLAITAATNTINQQLQSDPQNQGESRPDGERIMFAPPLGILFEVHPARNVVTVLHVWRFRQHS